MFHVKPLNKLLTTCIAEILVSAWFNLYAIVVLCRT